MSDSVITLKVEDQLKKEASKVAKDLGIPLATYLKMCLKKLAQEKSIHFGRTEVPKPTVAARWQKQEEDIKAGKNIKSFETIKDLKKDLLA